MSVVCVCRSFISISRVRVVRREASIRLGTFSCSLDCRILSTVRLHRSVPFSCCRIYIPVPPIDGGRIFLGRHSILLDPRILMVMMMMMLTMMLINWELLYHIASSRWSILLLTSFCCLWCLCSLCSRLIVIFLVRAIILLLTIVVVHAKRRQYIYGFMI